MESGATGAVQSIARAFALLEALADAGGALGVAELAGRSGLPQPTIHRLLRTLVELGYARQEPSRKYALGPRLVPLGEVAGRRLGAAAEPRLRRVVDAFGESANLALLDGHEIVYVAQSPGRHAMRMFTEVGRRAPLHCTAVGKAILAQLDGERAAALVARAGMAAQTPRTLTSPQALERELASIRARGYATDEQEQELGVRCVGVALPGVAVHAAVSISAPALRLTDDVVARALPLLRDTAAALASALG